jgi:hypothetical protein
MSFASACVGNTEKISFYRAARVRPKFRQHRTTFELNIIIMLRIKFCRAAQRTECCCYDAQLVQFSRSDLLARVQSGSLSAASFFWHLGDSLVLLLPRCGHATDRRLWRLITSRNKGPWLITVKSGRSRTGVK